MKVSSVSIIKYWRLSREFHVIRSVDPENSCLLTLLIGIFSVRNAPKIPILTEVGYLLMAILESGPKQSSTTH